MLHPRSTGTERAVASRSVVILDCGGQYAHLIGNRVRRLGAYSEIRIAETSASELKSAAGIILSGGPQSVYDEGSPQCDPAIFELGIPVLGLCYGHQLMAHQLEGKVTPGTVKEYGRTDIEILDPACPIFRGIPTLTTVWMSHGDEVTTLPAGFTRTAKSATCAIAAMADEARNIYGLQFHVEVTHTRHGLEILKNFIGLCDAAPWSVEKFADHIGAQIAAEAKDRKVFMLVSGGVDSTVAFTLLNKVLGSDRVQGLLVDTGLMRKGEVAMVRQAFEDLGITNLAVEDASEEFFAALEGVFDPEEKRKKIGDTFLAVQRRVSERMGLQATSYKLPAPQWLLGQGTIYPDTIETGGTKHADHIKTHHNRVAAVQALIERGLVIEPLKELYKDEVRRLGEELGLPRELVERHPFPGPGLGVRILCAASPVEMTFPDAAIEARERQLLSMPHLALPVRSVGVQGDGRTYRHAVAVFSHRPCAITPEEKALATTVPNAIPVFNRVLKCLSHSSPPALQFSPGFLTRERADLLREADAIVTAELWKAGLYDAIWQFPVVLLPFGMMHGGQSIVLRPVASVDAMTADAAILPPDVFESITNQLIALPCIEIVFLDLTQKPPGTIEWE